MSSFGRGFAYPILCIVVSIGQTSVGESDSIIKRLYAKIQWTTLSHTLSMVTIFGLRYRLEISPPSKKIWKKNSGTCFCRKKNFGTSGYTKATSLLCEMSSNKVSIFLAIERLWCRANRYAYRLHNQQRIAEFAMLHKCHARRIHLATLP